MIEGSGSGPYINSYTTGAHGVGNVRYNTQLQALEVYDGTSWLNMASSFVRICLTPQAEELLDYIDKKRLEEIELVRLAKTNNTVCDLYNQYKEKREQLDIVLKLLNEEKVKL